MIVNPSKFKSIIILKSQLSNQTKTVFNRKQRYRNRLMVKLLGIQIVDQLYFNLHIVTFVNLLPSNLMLNPLSANPTKLSNTLKQFVGNSPTNCLGVSDHFVKLALKGLTLKGQIEKN